MTEMTCLVISTTVTQSKRQTCIRALQKKYPNTSDVHISMGVRWDKSSWTGQTGRPDCSGIPPDDASASTRRGRLQEDESRYEVPEGIYQQDTDTRGRCYASSEMVGRNASFAVHHDMKSHTGATMSLGKGSVYLTLVRQKLNTKSSTEAELVGVDDVMPQVIWMRYFLEAQGSYGVRESKIYCRTTKARC